MGSREHSRASVLQASRNVERDQWLIFDHEDASIRFEEDTVASKDRLRATELIVGKLPGCEPAGTGRGFRRGD
jgi:hypothetical protein